MIPEMRNVQRPESIFQFMFLLFVFTLISCSPANKLNKTELTALKSQVENSVVFKKGFTGFALLDPEKGKMIFEQNADKYFTPGSVTKILTLYTAMNVLGDSLAALRYIEQGDSLIFWGAGDPTFLHPEFAANSRVLDFLKSRKEQLFFCPDNFRDEHFGAGWMWDDYAHAFQTEKAPFPIYSNVVRFERSPAMEKPAVRPGYFYAFTELDKDLGGDMPRIHRTERGNRFTYNPQALTGEPFHTATPFDYSAELLVQLLADTLGRQVRVLNAKLLPPEESKLLYTNAADTVYRRMMQQSDNFVAEQLLLQCSDKLFLKMNTGQVISWAKDSLLRNMPDVPRWFDGSGVSRYNLVTPRFVVALLDSLYQKNSREKLFGIFPTGGISGTIKKYYSGNPPYVIAKTGTLSNVHNLSGYLLTNSGKTLIFSFMHNNFTLGSDDLKTEMERILSWVRDNY